MSFQIYDFRKDLKNVLVTPEIRSRFLFMKSGQKVDLQNKAAGHSHDLGYEIFLLMQGKVRGLIDGEEGILGPGQLCIAAPHQTHAFEVIGDEDVIMYLSVTPHIQPTHTFYSELGRRLPHKFQPNSSYDLSDLLEDDIESLLDKQVNLTESLKETINKFSVIQKELVNSMKTKSKTSEPDDEMHSLRDQLWDEMIGVFRETVLVADVWNTVSPHLAKKQ